MVRRAPAGAAVLQPHITDAIAEAVLQELADKGYARLSIEAVARRAGVGKSALYRRWPSKQDMVLAVIADLRTAVFTAPDTGSLFGDLEALMRSITDWLAYPRIAPILADLVAETARDADLGDAVERIIRTPQRAKTIAIFDRASARGELSPNAKPQIGVELIASIVYWRIIVRAEPVTDDFIDAVLTTIQNGLAPVLPGQKSID